MLYIVSLGIETPPRNYMHHLSIVHQAQCTPVRAFLLILMVSTQHTYNQLEVVHKQFLVEDVHSFPV